MFYVSHTFTQNNVFIANMLQCDTFAELVGNFQVIWEQKLFELKQSFKKLKYFCLK